MSHPDVLVAELQQACTGEVEARASLAPLTTLKVGGPARALVTAETVEDLVAVGTACLTHDVPWLVVGRGSNLLVADAGWHGVAIALGRGFRGFDVHGSRVVAGAAEPMPVLAVRLAREGIVGFAWAAAVPGSIGGAVRMNAGAHGAELSDHLVEVDVLRLRTGERATLAAADLHLRYRSSDLPDDAVVVSATLDLARGDARAEQARIREVKVWRRAHQPINEPNCGSVFTNPPDDASGRLVEAVGGKDLRIGGAQVSDRHANFIVTEPSARAEDVRRLIEELQRRVARQHGVALHPEVVMVGDFGGRTDARTGGGGA